MTDLDIILDKILEKWKEVVIQKKLAGHNPLKPTKVITKRMTLLEMLEKRFEYE